MSSKSHSSSDNKKDEDVLESTTSTQVKVTRSPTSSSSSSSLVLGNNQMSDFSKIIDTSIINENKVDVVESIVEDNMNKYEKIEYHWFYTKKLQEKVIWIPFSNKDSKNLDVFYVKNK